MKLSTICTLATATILLIFATVTVAHADDINSTSLTFVRSILNASPKDVQSKLGKPDKGIKPSNDCSHLPSCTVATYQSGKFEVLFYNNRLKWIEIKGNNLFGKNAPELIGFLSAPPTFENKFIQSWRSAERKGAAKGSLIPINGIDEIAVFPPNDANNDVGYMLIIIGVSYDKTFSK